MINERERNTGKKELVGKEEKGKGENRNNKGKVRKRNTS